MNYVPNPPMKPRQTADDVIRAVARLNEVVRAARHDGWDVRVSLERDPAVFPSFMMAADDVPVDAEVASVVALLTRQAQ